MRNAKQNKKTKEKKSFKDQVMIIKLNEKNCIIKKSVLEINFAPLKILPLKYFKQKHFYFFLNNNFDTINILYITRGRSTLSGYSYQEA